MTERAGPCHITNPFNRHLAFCGNTDPSNDTETSSDSESLSHATCIACLRLCAAQHARKVDILDSQIRQMRIGAKNFAREWGLS